jgi:putative transposase
MKQIVSRKASHTSAGNRFWQPRYYDFNVWSEGNRVEKLRYIHNNPVKRGLVANPEEWAWSSSRHYASGEESVVEIESWWTAKRREAFGIHPTIRRVS